MEERNRFLKLAVLEHVLAVNKTLQYIIRYAGVQTPRFNLATWAREDWFNLVHPYIDGVQK